MCHDKAIFHYELYPRSVNSERYIGFLERLREKHGKGKIILYLDNLKVHKSKVTVEVYKRLNITTIYSPVYSPELNPIEYVFSKLKQKVKLMRLKDMMHKKKRCFDELVPIAANEVKEIDVNNCI